MYGAAWINAKQVAIEGYCSWRQSASAPHRLALVAKAEVVVLAVSHPHVSQDFSFAASSFREEPASCW
jgi:hypothetical protein